MPLCVCVGGGCLLFVVVVVNECQYIWIMPLCVLGGGVFIDKCGRTQVLWVMSLCVVYVVVNEYQ